MQELRTPKHFPAIDSKAACSLIKILRNNNALFLGQVNSSLTVTSETALRDDVRENCRNPNSSLTRACISQALRCARTFLYQTSSGCGPGCITSWHQLDVPVTRLHRPGPTMVVGSRAPYGDLGCITTGHQPDVPGTRPQGPGISSSANCMLLPLHLGDCCRHVSGRYRHDHRNVIRTKCGAGPGPSAGAPSDGSRCIIFALSTRLVAETLGAFLSDPDKCPEMSPMYHVSVHKQIVRMGKLDPHPFSPFAHVLMRAFANLGFDLSRKSAYPRLQKESLRCKPRKVWVSLPCEPWLNQDKLRIWADVLTKRGKARWMTRQVGYWLKEYLTAAPDAEAHIN